MTLRTDFDAREYLDSVQRQVRRDLDDAGRIGASRSRVTVGYRTGLLRSTIRFRRVRSRVYISARTAYAAFHEAHSRYLEAGFRAAVSYLVRQGYNRIG